MSPTTPGDRFRESVLEALERYERDRAAAIRRADPGTLDNTGLLTLAQDYARAADPEQRDQLAASIATRLTVDEAGVILRAAAAIRTALPRIVLRAKEDGDTTAEIARELGKTDSYIRRIVREHRLVSWRLDLHNSELGPGWQPYEVSDDIIPTAYTVADLAEHIITAAGRGPRYHPSRVLIWDGVTEQPDDAAIYTHEPLWKETDAPRVAAEAVEFERKREAERSRATKVPRYWRLDRQWDADNLPAGEWHTVCGGGPFTGGRPRTDAEQAAYLLDRERRDQPAAARLRVTVWRGSDTPGPLAAVACSESQ
ncbi:hypothetical protein ACWCQQ_38415 [Streptomyces sp. NPDC002143]